MYTTTATSPGGAVTCSHGVCFHPGHAGVRLAKVAVLHEAEQEAEDQLWVACLEVFGTNVHQPATCHKS